jgi:hypothetical protein
MPENFAQAAARLRRQIRVNPALTHSLKINHRFCVILLRLWAGIGNFCKINGMTAPLIKAFERDTYMPTYGPFYQTNPIFYRILSDASRTRHAARGL